MTFTGDLVYVALKKYLIPKEAKQNVQLFQTLEENLPVVSDGNVIYFTSVCEWWACRGKEAKRCIWLRPCGLVPFVCLWRQKFSHKKYLCGQTATNCPVYLKNNQKTTKKETMSL